MEAWMTVSVQREDFDIAAEMARLTAADPTSAPWSASPDWCAR